MILRPSDSLLDDVVQHIIQDCGLDLETVKRLPKDVGIDLILRLLKKQMKRFSSY